MGFGRPPWEDFGLPIPRLSLSLMASLGSFRRPTHGRGPPDAGAHWTASIFGGSFSDPHKSYMAVSTIWGPSFGCRADPYKSYVAVSMNLV